MMCVWFDLCFFFDWASSFPTPHTAHTAHTARRERLWRRFDIHNKQQRRRQHAIPAGEARSSMCRTLASHLGVAPAEEMLERCRIHKRLNYLPSVFAVRWDLGAIM